MSSVFQTMPTEVKPYRGRGRPRKGKNDNIVKRYNKKSTKNDETVVNKFQSQDHRIKQFPPASRGDGTNRRKALSCRYCPNKTEDKSRNSRKTSYYCSSCDVGFHPECFFLFHEQERPTPSRKRKGPTCDSINGKDNQDHIHISNSSNNSNAGDDRRNNYSNDNQQPLSNDHRDDHINNSENN